MMRARKNPEAIAKVFEADLRGDEMRIRKPLYIEQNTFDIDLDTPIFRIFQTHFLLSDIRNSHLTHTRIGPMVWGDPAENPLLDRLYIDDATGGRISLRPLIEDMFAVCWSLAPDASPEMWDYFSHGTSSVRIQTTPRKLLNGVMHLDNPFFMLHHFIGRVDYPSENEFDAFYDDDDYTKYLDSLGQSLALSVMRLPDDASTEQEVRLVYSLGKGEDWTSENVEVSGDFAKVPFSWWSVVENIVPGIDCELATIGLIRSELGKYSPHQANEQPL